jgi:hypothetical protein
MSFIPRSLMLLALASTLALLSNGASAALRANYEITVSSQGKTYSIRTVETLGDGKPIVQELGSYQVEIQPVIDATGSYTLRVRVMAASTSRSSVSFPIEHSFPGSLGGPLEFSAEFGDAQVSGAIMLNPLAGEG